MKTLKYFCVVLCILYYTYGKCQVEISKIFFKENKIEFYFLFILFVEWILCGKDLYDVRNLDDLAVQLDLRT